ncbi:ERF family protein [Achromobacter xylosoxidans]|uniref:hypothetical protein n=1 Tax=Alcaligenes xylosoxydans xylosoxydans TaxID=85698 RepID=UPI0038FC708C
MTEIIDAPAREVAPRPEPNPGHLPALAANSPMGMMLAAVQQGATLEQVEKMMDLQERWAKAEAKKAYDEAFANFKAEAVKIIKGKDVTDGPLKGKAYAELHDVVNAVTPALSKHGLSSSWKLTRDDRDWMEVTCYLRHVGGHEESVSMGGPPRTTAAPRTPSRPAPAPRPTWSATRSRQSRVFRSRTTTPTATSSTPNRSGRSTAG